MTDPADRFLQERLHALAREVSVPVVPADADLRRGRRRLFRMRVAMAGATTGTLAVVLGITGLTAGDPKATELPVTQPPTTLPATPITSPSDAKSDDATPDGEHQAKGGDLRVGDQPDTDLTGQGTDPAGRGGSPNGGGVTGAPSSAAPGTTHGGADTGHYQPSDGTPASDPTETPASTVTATSAPTGTPTGTPTAEPTGTPTSTPTVPPTGTTKVQVHRVLRYYNEVLAEQLDPDRDHLQPYDRAIDTKETTRRDGVLFALGASYRWEAGGSRAGLGITVASGWDQVDWDCGASDTDWQCHVADAGGVAPAEVATHDGVRQVAVEHSDGQVVVVTADRSIRRVDDELVTAASDDRLILPGDAPVAPPVLDVETFAPAGVAALVRTGESFDQSSVDRSPQVRGTWAVAGAARGTLSWAARPVYAGARWECLRSYRTCEDVVVDESGTTVHLAAVRARAGGGWVIQYDGPSYAVRIYASDRTFPKRRAYAFVTQPGWQPVR